MKLISSIVFCFVLNSAFSQEWPWFFSETAFKKWLVEKDVKCLKHVSADFDYEDIRTAEYWPGFSKRITSYYFDQTGVLESIKLEEIEISLYEDGFQSEENYYYIINVLFPSMPLTISESDKSMFYDYDKSTYFPGIKIYSLSRAVAPDGTMFQDYRRVEKSDAPFPFAYQYSLRQEVQLEKGEIVSVKNYAYSGDFYIPHLTLAAYERINDSVSVLIETGHINFYDDQTGSTVGKDTIINHPYYRKISQDNGLIEFGVYIQDTVGQYCFIPLKRIYTNETGHENSQIITQVYDHSSRQLTPVSIFDNYSDYRSLVHGDVLRVTNGEWSWYEYPCYNIDYYSNNAESTKTVSCFNKKTNEFSEQKIYALENNVWRLISHENKTKTGYLQNHYAPGWKKPTYQIEISSDAYNNPVFTTLANEKEEIIFRISGDSIYLTADENFYGHFLVEYE